MKRPFIDGLNQGFLILKTKTQFPSEVDRFLEIVNSIKIKSKRKLPNDEKAIINSWWHFPMETHYDSRNEKLSNTCGVPNLYV